MSQRPLYIFGAGGHGKVIAEAAGLLPENQVRAFVDDSPEKRGKLLHGLRIISSEDIPAGAEVVPAIGFNQSRAEVSHRLLKAGFRLATVVHPTAFISKGAVLGEGSFVGPLAVVHTDARVGRGCIVNSGSIVEHDNVLSDWVHISPNGTLGGNVTVGEGGHIGMGAAILSGLRVGKWAVVGAGAVVIADVDDGVTVVGVPARAIGSSKAESR